MLNVASTGMFTILALIVNLKWYECKKWTSSLKLVDILAQCRYAKTAQRIFKYSDTQYTSLTLDKILNSLIYRTLFYVNIYGSYKLLKTVRFFDPPCIVLLAVFDHHTRSEEFLIICTEFNVDFDTNFWYNNNKNAVVDLLSPYLCY